MSTQSINQNLVPVRNPTLKDLLDLYQKQTLLGFNCHHLATIQSFNATTQTVQATINYKKTYFNFVGAKQTYEPQLTDYPLVADCPVIVLGGGTTHITFPIAKGDQCILLFNDRDIDNWYNGSTTSPNQTPRLHAFADCLALIGPNNLNTVIASYDTVRAIITNGTTKIGINPSSNKITLTNGTTLNSLLQNLCTQLQNLTTAIAQITVLPGTFNVAAVPVAGVSGLPVNASSITMIGSNISNIATNISNLLE